MKVLFVHSHRFAFIEGEYYSPGGLPSTAWKRYLIFFQEVVVLGRTLNTNSSEKLTKSSLSNVSFELLGYLESPLAFYRYKSKIINDIKAIIDKYKIEAVIVRLPSEIGNITISICKELNIPYAVEVVGCTLDTISNYKIKPKYNYKNFLIKILAPISYIKMKRNVLDANHVLYVTKEFLQSRYPSKKSVFTVNASNVVLPNFENEILERHISLIQNTNKNNLRFGMIGNIDVPYKGFEIILKALSLIKNKIPFFKLYIVGDGEGKELLKMINLLKLTEHVELVGKLSSGDEIFRFLDSLDLYLHPSLVEGLPRSLIEAMGRGCPCLGSKVGGIPELLPEEYLHNKGDYIKLSNQIVDLVTNREKLELASEFNFWKAKDYSDEVLSEKRIKFWGAFYNSLIK